MVSTIVTIQLYKSKNRLMKKKLSNFYLRGIYGHGGRLNYEKEWRFKKISGGGELIDKGSHLIDLSVILGDLKVSFSKLKTYFYKMKLEDNCFLNLENKKGSIAFACIKH